MYWILPQIIKSYPLQHREPVKVHYFGGSVQNMDVYKKTVYM